jgi:hypothetical protein
MICAITSVLQIIIAACPHLNVIMIGIVLTGVIPVPYLAKVHALRPDAAGTAFARAAIIHAILTARAHARARAALGNKTGIAQTIPDPLPVPHLVQAIAIPREDAAGGAALAAEPLITAIIYAAETTTAARIHTNARGIPIVLLHLMLTAATTSAIRVHALRPDAAGQGTIATTIPGIMLAAHLTGIPDAALNITAPGQPSYATYLALEIAQAIPAAHGWTATMTRRIVAHQAA